MQDWISTLVIVVPLVMLVGTSIALTVALISVQRKRRRWAEEQRRMRETLPGDLALDAALTEEHGPGAIQGHDRT